MTAPDEHPEPVKAAIRNAARDPSLTAAEIGRRLRNGTLTGLDEPYKMPRSTVEYYVRTTRKKDAAQMVTKLASGDPNRAVDHLARQLLSEAELGIMAARQAKQRDPETLKKYADLLKVVGPLLRPPEEKPKRRRREKPSDPLTARLTTTDKPSPDTTPAGDREEADQTTTTPINDHDQTNNSHNHGHNHGRVVVQARVPDHGPLIRAEQGGGGHPGRISPPDTGVAPPFAPHLADPRR